MSITRVDFSFIKDQTNVATSPIIHFITYGDGKYTRSKQLICNEALKTKWFESVKVYNKKKLSPSFRQDFSEILAEKRGGGYYMWKFDIILQRLEEIKEGEFLVYCDSGCFVNVKGEKRFREYIRMIRNDDRNMISFQMRHLLEKCWTTEEVFKCFDVPEGHTIRNSGQLVGGILIMQKCDNVVNLFQDCVKRIKEEPFLITDHYNTMQNSKDFKEHRHDQSILSVARKKIGLSIIIEDETHVQHPFLSSIPFIAARRRLC